VIAQSFGTSSHSGSLFGKGIDERVIPTVDDVVEVLDAHYRSDRLRLDNLLGGDMHSCLLRRGGGLRRAREPLKGINHSGDSCSPMIADCVTFRL
jgi:hypothetical protein